jgi:hypothetical protein
MAAVAAATKAAVIAASTILAITVEFKKDNNGPRQICAKVEKMYAM